MLLVHEGNSLAEVVLSRLVVVDAFESEDGLVGVEGDVRPGCWVAYLRKLRNLALTHSLTSLGCFFCLVTCFLELSNLPIVVNYISIKIIILVCFPTLYF